MPVPGRHQTEAAEALAGVAPLVSRWMERLLASHEPPLTLPQYLALLAVDRGAVSAAELARRSGVSPASTSQLLAALHDAGLLERRASADDRRRQELLLSRRGRAALRDAERLVRERLRDLLADVPPPDLDGAGRAALVADFCERAIPAAPALGAEAVDVYCDAGAFTLDETRLLLTAARAAGLALRVHAEQFTYTGAAELAAELGARSVEHLEEISEAGVAALARAGTVCNLLPGAALTLKLKWPDARRLLDAGCRVALGTDCNPGSSLTESLPLMMSLACMQMGMSCAEALQGVTTAAARSVGRSDAGRLAPGARGDLVVWDAGDHREVAQHYGVQLAKTVVVAGRVVGG